VTQEIIGSARLESDALKTFVKMLLGDFTKTPSLSQVFQEVS
jgi:hypothetical protein